LHRSRTSPRPRNFTREQSTGLLRGLDGSVFLLAPVLDQRKSDREQRRPEEHADEAERDDAAEDAEKHEDEWQVAAAADDERLDYVVDAAYHCDAPDQQEDGPAGVALTVKPERRRRPDERRADRHGRQKEGQESQQRRGGNAGKPEADRGEHALRDRGAENA